MNPTTKVEKASENRCVEGCVHGHPDIHSGQCIVVNPEWQQLMDSFTVTLEPDAMMWRGEVYVGLAPVGGWRTMDVWYARIPAEDIDMAGAQEILRNWARWAIAEASKRRPKGDRHGP